MSRVRLGHRDPGGAVGDEGAGDCGAKRAGLCGPSKQLEFGSGYNRATEGFLTGE